ncbi:hypothetical protein FQA39_LY01089 [Lamprigera yunnana]|nr:hypothetical protein FQA39_LY01089 [Lamprigera yunnana]
MDGSDSRLNSIATTWGGVYPEMKYLNAGDDDEEEETCGANSNNIQLKNGEEIKICQEYKYLGATFDTSGTDDREINSIIIQAYYGVKGCKLSSSRIEEIDRQEQKKVEATEIDVLRRSRMTLRIGIEGTIATHIEKKQLTWYGHVQRMVWFKNRRAKWRKQKREEQERMRKLQEEEVCRVVEQPRLLAPPSHYSEDDSSDLEVA